MVESEERMNLRRVLAFSEDGEADRYNLPEPPQNGGFSESKAKRASRARINMLRLDGEDDDDSDMDLDYDSSPNSPRGGKGGKSASEPEDSDAAGALYRSSSMPIPQCYDEYNMIDLDAMKRKTRLKSNSKIDKPSVKKGRLWFIRVLLFPFFFRWWSTKLNIKWLCLSLFIYMAQVCVSLLYYFVPPTMADEVTTFEVKFPLVLLVLVAGLMGHCAAISSAIGETIRKEQMEVDEGDTYDDVGSVCSSVVGQEAVNVNSSRMRRRKSSTGSKSKASDNSSSSSSDDDDATEESDSEYDTQKRAATLEESEVERKVEGFTKSRPKSSPAGTFLPLNLRNHIEKATATRPSLAHSPKASSVRSLFWSRQGVEDQTLSVNDIRKAIYEKIRTLPVNTTYVFLADAFAISLALIPMFYRLFKSMHPLVCWLLNQPGFTEALTGWDVSTFSSLCVDFESSGNMTMVPEDIHPLVCYLSSPEDNCKQSIFESAVSGIWFLLDSHRLTTAISICSMISMGYLFGIFFQFIAVAEDAFRRRYLYAKYFSVLTSSRRSKKAKLPHFRLNKVNHIRVWLDLRSDPREAHNSTYRFGDAAANILVLTTLLTGGAVCLRVFFWNVDNISIRRLGFKCIRNVSHYIHVQIYPSCHADEEKI
uniref:PHTF1/2 N-terminal domain-containing protein n=1 Tax=Mucochytrium quahogii TaxID=96639 RepID=A0A7S2SQZ3_9STRA|mmetsp:Transcript_9856/g.21470  ORF Transcript_9856/g.21470 Transcript_9856/m.21470 type:complete len:649 (+) Transcript_9856:210-2156(+)